MDDVSILADDTIWPQVGGVYIGIFQCGNKRHYGGFQLFPVFGKYMEFKFVAITDAQLGCVVPLPAPNNQVGIVNGGFQSTRIQPNFVTSKLSKLCANAFCSELPKSMPISNFVPPNGAKYLIIAASCSATNTDRESSFNSSPAIFNCLCTANSFVGHKQKDGADGLNNYAHKYRGSSCIKFLCLPNNSDTNKYAAQYGPKNQC